MIAQNFRAITLKIFHRECRLPGRWERVGDRFEGCVISIPVLDSTGETQGRISVCPAPMKAVGWREKDLKWKGIRRVDKNSYVLADLFKEYDPETDTVSRFDYLEARLVFVGAHTIAIESMNRVQQWRRIGAE